MLDMINNPALTMFDSDFLSYAGNEVISKTFVAFAGIWMACRFFDLVTDREARPSTRHLLIRGIAAFCVPFAVILSTAYSQTMPSSYRLYKEGTYDIGSSLPAGTYALSAGLGEASVSISDGDGNSVSHKWRNGNMDITVYDGDEMTIAGCTARNKTSQVVYRADARNMAIANGGAFLVGGSDLKPGTYEITSRSDDSEYELREGYLKVGSPLDAEPFDGVVYADVHYGDVLYVRDASVVLYSNVFPLPKDEVADTDEQETKGKEGSDAKAKAGKEAPTEGKAEAAPDENVEDKSDDANPAGKGVSALKERVENTPWSRGPYVSETSVETSHNDGTEDATDIVPTVPGPSFHDMIQRIAVTTATAKTLPSEE